MSRLQYLIQKNDFNKPAEDIACDLIWAATGIRIRRNQLRIGAIRESGVVGHVYLSAKVLSHDDHRLVGTNGFIIQRLPLASIQGIEELVFHRPKEAFRVTKILSQLNARLGINLTDHDVEDDVVDCSKGYFTLRAKSTSWAWEGSVVVKLGEVVEPFIYFTDYSQYQNNTLLDLSKSTETLFNDMINSKNGSTYQLNKDYVLINLMASPRHSIRNTQVTIQPMLDTFSPVTIHYNRLRLEDAVKVPTTPLVINKLPFSTVSNIEDINAYLGTSLSPNEVSDVVINSREKTMVLSIATNYQSVIWQMSKLTIPLTYNPHMRFLPNGYPRRLPDKSHRGFN